MGCECRQSHCRRSRPGDEDGVLAAHVLLGRVAFHDSLVEHGAVVHHVQPVGLVRVFRARMDGKRGPGDVGGHGGLVAAGGHAASGRLSA